jgi:anti-sigma regulatory factor (Ser/Thr protein kinase)
MIGPKRAGDQGQMASLELDIERGRHAPAISRAAISGLCERVGLTGARCHTLRLLVSELVTNAVLHSEAPPTSPIRLAADSDNDRVRVEVADGGRPFTPPDAARARGGWGLRLVEKEARCWGVEDVHGTMVWFELGVRRADASADGTHLNRSCVSH